MLRLSRPNHINPYILLFSILPSSFNPSIIQKLPWGALDFVKNQSKPFNKGM